MPASTEQLLKDAQQFFLEKIARAHLKNTLKLTKLSEFNVNPFTDRYLARFLTGTSDARSLAKVLILSRVLSSSINTTFGHAMQAFCGEVLQKGFGSVVPGVDIEFVDTIDGNLKYCQVKSGPDTINLGDVDTINGHFTDARNIGRANRRVVDLCVGVLYGSHDDLNQWYKRLESDHGIAIYAGQDFWTRLTGDASFYGKLAHAFSESVKDLDGTRVLEEVEKQLAAEIEKRDKPENPV